VRIEAEGYQPQISDEFVAEMKSVPLKIELRR